ncbi:hypothetical protein COI47_19130 [Bacillus pseudomycoides]|nr:hypothetical protein COI47_19130 [Bacillus pseudomycoides]
MLLVLFSLFVLTWHGAGKGSDRFYAWADALFHLKKNVFYQFSNLYLTYIELLRITSNILTLNTSLFQNVWIIRRSC